MKYIITILIFLCGCSTPHYITNTDTIYVNNTKYLYDSIFIKDSMGIKLVNDTVYIDRWHKLVKTVNKTDTVVKIEARSVPYEVEVVKEVDKPLNLFQFSLMCMGVFFLLIILTKILIKLKIIR